MKLENSSTNTNLRQHLKPIDCFSFSFYNQLMNPGSGSEFGFSPKPEGKIDKLKSAILVLPIFRDEPLQESRNVWLEKIGATQEYLSAQTLRVGLLMARAEGTHFEHV